MKEVTSTTYCSHCGGTINKKNKCISCNQQYKTLLPCTFCFSCEHIITRGLGSVFGICCNLDCTSHHIRKHGNVVMYSNSVIFMQVNLLYKQLLLMKLHQLPYIATSQFEQPSYSYLFQFFERLWNHRQFYNPEDQDTNI